MNNIDITDIPQPINDNLIIDLTKNRKFKKDKNSYSVSLGQFGKIISILKKNLIMVLLAETKKLRARVALLEGN